MNANMTTFGLPRPDFGKPPIAEVVFSIQFNPLTEVQTPHLGLLWNEFKSDFPKAEQHPPLDAMTERFGTRSPSDLNLRFEMGVPVPRCWFLNTIGTELIQVQQDRFIQNWRKFEEEDKYPRYEYLRPIFEKRLETFTQFLAREHLGKITPNQCEVTYINHLVSGEGWERHGQIGEVITTWEPRYSGDFLQEPEDVRFFARYVIPDATGHPLGRLHINMQPAYRRKDEKPIFVLELTARGRPYGEGIEGVWRFLDLGHEWVVRGFASITSSSMHKLWERYDVTR